MARRGALLPPKPWVIDSSCWLEVFDGGQRAALFEPAIAAPQELVVPVITLYEVYKYLARVKGAESATRAVLYIQRGRVVGIDSAIAVAAAGNGLPMADSLIYATAQAFDATVWTQDAHFQDMPGVKYFAKPELSKQTGSAARGDNPAIRDA